MCITSPPITNKNKVLRPSWTKLESALLIIPVGKSDYQNASRDSMKMFQPGEPAVSLRSGSHETLRKGHNSEEEERRSVTRPQDRGSAPSLPG